MTNASTILLTSSSIAEQAGRKELASFWSGMANDALQLEALLPGADLYRHWANDAAEYAAKLEREKAA